MHQLVLQPVRSFHSNLVEKFCPPHTQQFGPYQKLKKAITETIMLEAFSFIAEKLLVI